MEKKSNQTSFQVSDRRFWVNDESAVEKATVPQKKYPSVVEELKERTELAEKRLREKLEELDRENEAYRSRLRKELERRFETEKSEILKGFLEVADNFERGLQATGAESDSESLRKGLELNLELLLARLRQSGIEPLDVEGQPFDPHVAEAVGTVNVTDSQRDQTVVEVVQRGYRCGDQLLRPARVRVGIYQPPEKEG